MDPERIKELLSLLTVEQKMQLLDFLEKLHTEKVKK